MYTGPRLESLHHSIRLPRSLGYAACAHFGALSLCSHWILLSPDSVLPFGGY
jgi:hypothetical protein